MDFRHAALGTEDSGALACEREVCPLFAVGALDERH